MLCVCVCGGFEGFRVFDALCMVFLIGSADRPVLVAIGVGFLVFLCFRCYVRGFFDRFSRQANR